MERRPVNDAKGTQANFEDLEMELDGEQEQIWEQSMSSLINEMRLQLQRDLSGQHSVGVESSAFEDVMDRFIESTDFEQALSYGGGRRRNRAEAKPGHDNQKAGSPGGKALRSLNDILQGKHQVKNVEEVDDQEGDVPSPQGLTLKALINGGLGDDVMIPELRYEKSFLRKIPSVIMEAHESIISQKNDEAPARKGMTQEDLTDFINQVHQESAQSAQSCNSNSAAEEAYSSQNVTYQRHATKKSRSHQQQKFFEKSACFDVPSAQDVPVDLFD